MLEQCWKGCYNCYFETFSGVVFFLLPKKDNGTLVRPIISLLPILVEKVILHGKRMLCLGKKDVFVKNYFLSWNEEAHFLNLLI